MKYIAIFLALVTFCGACKTNDLTLSSQYGINLESIQEKETKEAIIKLTEDYDKDEKIIWLQDRKLEIQDFKIKNYENIVKTLNPDKDTKIENKKDRYRIWYFIGGFTAGALIVWGVSYSK